MLILFVITKKKKKIIPLLEKILLKLKNIFFFSANAFLSTSWSLTSAFGNGILTMITLLFGAFGLMFNLILFFTCLFYLLSAKQSVLQTFRNLMAKMQAQQLTDAIENSINSVFECSIKMCVFHGSFTWLTFSYLEIPNVYINSCLSGNFNFSKISS